MAAFDSDAFDSTNAFSEDAFDFGTTGGSPAPIAFLTRVRRHRRSAMTTLTPIKG